MKINRKQGVLKDSAGRKISISSWIPNRSFCQLVIMHGFSEHMKYYESIAQYLGENGIAIHMMDLPGHGMSEGIRGHIDDFREYLDNLTLLLQENPNWLKTKPAFLMGHSLGGLISTHYCLKVRHPFKGLILSAPLAGFSPVSSTLVKLLARYLAKDHLNQPFVKPSGVKSLSRNPENWELYYSDPCRGRMISPNLYLTMDRKIKELHLAAPALDLPLLVFLSAKDSVVSPDGVQSFFHAAGSRDKSMIVFSEAMHELFQEEEIDQMLPKIMSWIKERA